MDSAPWKCEPIMRTYIGGKWSRNQATSRVGFQVTKFDVIYVAQMALFVEMAAGSSLCLYRNDLPMYYFRDSLRGRR